MLKMRERRGVRPSSIERAVAAELDRRGIPFEQEFRIGRYQADFLLPGGKVIECDGVYWHQDAEKDKRRDQYLLERGYRTFRLPEAAITADVSSALSEVLS